MNIDINEIVSYYSKNDNLNISREYLKSYNNMKLVNIIIGMVDINTSMTILDGNIMINSFLDKIMNIFFGFYF
jgi:hypothetical protein